MDDKELFAKFESYMKDHGWTFEQASKYIGFEKSTLFNWKSGKPISPRGRQALNLLISVPDQPEESLQCYLKHCPANPPVDRLLQYILESWDTLTSEAKGKIVSIVDEDKKDTASKVG